LLKQDIKNKELFDHLKWHMDTALAR
jgi:hypothetical protein